MSKYRAKKAICGSIKFDSRAEMRRFGELNLLLKAKQIEHLRLQPRFLLQKEFVRAGVKYKKIEYVADFAYFDKAKNKIVVEDIKGMRTPVYLLKKKMFLAGLDERWEFFENCSGGGKR
jgi:hypothetical protein